MPKPNEESGNAVSVVSVLPVEAAPVNSLLKKNSGDDANGSAGSLKTSHTVRFAEEVDVVTIDPVQPKTEAQGFQSHSGGRSMDWDDMGEAPCTSNDQDDEDEEAIQRAAKRAAKKKAGKKGSFHAFRSDSDEDDDADGYAY